MREHLRRALDLTPEQAAKIEAKRTLPEFSPGDTVRVNVRVTEGTRTRVQAYEGVVIARSGGGINEMITVRSETKSRDSVDQQITRYSM